MTHRRRSRSLALLCASAWMLIACQAKEIDTKVMDDPLDDPWVAGLETGDAAAVAAVETEPTPSELAGPTEANVVDPAAAGEAEPAADTDAPDPAEATATPTTTNTGKAAGSNTVTSEPAPSIAPSDEAAPQPSAEPEPSQVQPAPEAKPEPAKPAEPPPITLADFNGTYRYSGGNAQREALSATIEETLLQLNAAIRGIGRKRLIKTNPIDDSVQIVINGDKVQTIFTTSGFDPTCTLGAPAISYTGKSGSKYKVRVVQQGSKLVQVIAGEDGVKTTVFVLSSDRQKLTVNHKITSDRLTTPMTYKLSFTRK